MSQKKNSSRLNNILQNTNGGISEDLQQTQIEYPSIQSALPYLEKRLSNYEHVDIIENGLSNMYKDEEVTIDNSTQFRQLSTEFEQIDQEQFINSGNNSHKNKKSPSQSLDSYEGISKQQIQKKESRVYDSYEYQLDREEKNNQMSGISDVYTKELKQCDFQLTYMKTEYKKEYLRFEFIPKLNNILYIKEKNVLLWPNCIEINNNYLIVGGGSGNFIVFSKLNYEYEIFNTQGSLKKINCIEMSEDFRVICIGDSLGTLGIYDMKKKKVIKFCEGLHQKSAVISIKIVNNQPEKLDNLQIITSDIHGQIKVTYLNKGMFKYSVNEKTIIEKFPYPIQQITLLSEEMKTKYQKNSNIDLRYLSFISLPFKLNQQKQRFKNQDFSVDTFSYLDLRFVNLCWGEGFIFEVAEYLYKTITKVVCWKNKLYILKVLPTQPSKDNKGTDEPFKFEESHPLVFEKDIIHSCFLAQSILFIVDSNQHLYLFNMSDLKKLFTQSMNAIDLCKENDILPFPLPVKEKLFFQLNKMNGNSGVQTFNQSKYDQEVLFIIDGRMGVGALTKWQTVYTNLIENGEWRQAMHYLTNIYYSKDKFVTNLSSLQSDRKLLLEESVKIVANKYLQMCLLIFSANNDEATKRNMIGLVVEFLVLTENYQFLFNELRMIVEEHLKCLDIFVESLVPFLRKYKIKWMPISYLNQLIDYFEKINQISLIEKMMIQLDSQLVNTHQLIEICLKKRLIKALIYICTKGEEGDDIYMTPLSKMWGHYLFHKYQAQGENILIQKSLSSESNEDERIFGERSLWYARICLKRHTITGEIIELQKYESLVYNLAQWVFTLNNLKEILLFSPLQGFEIIHLFFSNQTAEIINKKQFTQVNRNEKSDTNSRLSVNLNRSSVDSTQLSNSMIQSSTSNTVTYNQSVQHTQSLVLPSFLTSPITNKQNKYLESSGSNKVNSNFMNNFSKNSFTVLDEILETIQVCFDQIIEEDGPLSNLNNKITDAYSNNFQLDYIGKQYSDSVNSINIVSQIKQEYYLFIAKLFLQQNAGKSHIFKQSDYILDLNDSDDDTYKRGSNSRSSSKDSNSSSKIQKNYHLKKGQIFESLIFLIQNPQIINILHAGIEHPTPHINFIEWENELELAEMYQCQLVQFILSNVDFDNFQKETLNRLILQSFSFVELKAYIYKDMKEYKKSFDLFITSKNQLIQQRFFTFLNSILSNKQNKQDQQMQIIHNLMEDKLIEIIKINPEKTRELIKQHLSDLEARMIRKMKDFPEKQLEYIQCVIQERKEDCIPKDLLTLYIELLCTQYPSQVLSELEKYDYDLDACLNYCEVNKVQDATAYLYEKQGDIQSSFLIHLKIIEENYNEIINKYSQISAEEKQNNQYFNIQSLQQSIQKMEKEYSTMIALCKKIMQSNGISECVKLLYDLLDIFINMLNESTKKTDLTEDFYYKYISDLFIEMQKYVDLEYFMKELSDKYSHLKLRKLANSFLRITSDLEYVLQSYINTDELLCESLINFTLQFNKTFHNGFNGYPVCYVCLQAITNKQLSININKPENITKDTNGWIVEDSVKQTPNIPDNQTDSDKLKQNPQGNSKQTLLFQCSHFYHESCYSQVKQQIQTELSDKKSVLAEVSLCVICMAKQSNDLHMNILLCTEQKQKNLKDSILSTIPARYTPQSRDLRQSFHSIEQVKKPQNAKQENVNNSEKSIEQQKRIKSLQVYDKRRQEVLNDKKQAQQIINEL